MPVEGAACQAVSIKHGLVALSRLKNFAATCLTPFAVIVDAQGRLLLGCMALTNQQSAGVFDC
jgi:hypothetical protein